MIKKIGLFLCIGVSVLMSSCKNEEVIPNLDKEVRLNFPFEYWPSNKTQFELSPKYTHLIKFNKTNYSGLTSIKLYSAMATEVVGDTAELELFNITDNTAVANSLLMASTPSLSYQLVQSSNIINELPNKEIDLGIRLKSKKGQFVYARTPVLVLSRN
ncbi:hypothetical protein [Adhaeribacter soli]|uniref:Uncharacterized protein n=1 Tax=Adhaeribacter soli TaxID=2607655 RepID=A0A5N1J4C9_9BACT|nr:hypothetical protein [Adhaeribacter soli]KAA9345761.1 hypothetical protein F0P94_01360 [Adhaeribacter soli]